MSLDGSTHPCRAAYCGGGVARNIADALRKLGARPRLLAPIGDDHDGRLLASTVPELLGEGCVIPGARTANYTAVLDSRGECRLGLGDMAIHEALTPDIVERNMGLVREAPLLVLDGNLPQPTVDYVLTLAAELHKPVFFEPTDLRKAVKPFLNNHHVTFASPNINELRAMAQALGHKQMKTDHSNNYNEQISEALALAPSVMEHVKYLMVTLGESGVLVVKQYDPSTSSSVHHRFWAQGYEKQRNKLTADLYPVTPLQNIKNVSGAGDCLVSGFICAMLSGLNEEKCMAVGFEAAKMALYSENTVPDSFTIFEKINSIKCESITFSEV